MRALVTGATGLLGRALLNELQSGSSYDPIAISSQSCDLRQLDDCLRLFEERSPQVVFHLAARVFGVGGHLEYPFTGMNENLQINANVLEACQRFGVRKIVGMGSTAIYSDSVPRPFAEHNAFEGLPHGSELFYGLAKRSMYYQLVALQKQADIEFAYAISTNLYGPHDRFDPRLGHVIPSIVGKFVNAERQGGRNRQVMLWGDGSPRRDFLYAGDAARALLLMMERGEDAFNMASGAVVQIADVVAEIASHFDPDIEVVWNADQPMGQRDRAYDISRLTALGFRPKVSLQEGIRATVMWFRQNWSGAPRVSFSEPADGLIDH